jgi:hypothetical protein
MDQEIYYVLLGQGLEMATMDRESHTHRIITTLDDEEFDDACFTINDMFSPEDIRRAVEQNIRNRFAIECEVEVRVEAM